MSSTVFFLLIGASLPIYALDWGSEDTLIQLMENHARSQNASLGPPGVAPLDTIIDFLLSGTIPHIMSHGNSSFHLPNLSKEFKINEGPIQLTAGVSLEAGTLTDLRSMYRQGPSVLRRAPGGVLLLEVSAGMRHVRLQYQKYTMHVEDEKFSGAVEADVSPAAVRVLLSLQPPCRAHLQSLSVAALGPLRVTATGLGPLAGLPKLLEDLFAQPRLRAKMEDLVLGFVSRAVQQELDKLACK